jgi:xanthosine phosphorylase
MGLVLGSGLGPLADKLEDAHAIAYDDLPGFPQIGVSGHAGKLVLGYLGGVSVACLAGRAHAYEGRIDAMKVPVRAIKLIGAEALYLTCAAGSLRTSVDAGRLMTITDHINLMGGNPLAGPNDDDFGPRFPPMADAYDPTLIAAQKQEAASLGIDLAEDVGRRRCRHVDGPGMYRGPPLRPARHGNGCDHQSGRRLVRCTSPP